MPHPRSCHSPGFQPVDQRVTQVGDGRPHKKRRENGVQCPDHQHKNQQQAQYKGPPVDGYYRAHGRPQCRNIRLGVMSSETAKREREGNTRFSASVLLIPVTLTARMSP